MIHFCLSPQKWGWGWAHSRSKMKRFSSSKSMELRHLKIWLQTSTNSIIFKEQCIVGQSRLNISLKKGWWGDCGQDWESQDRKMVALSTLLQAPWRFSSCRDIFMALWLCPCGYFCLESLPFSRKILICQCLEVLHSLPRSKIFVVFSFIHKPFADEGV